MKKIRVSVIENDQETWAEEIWPVDGIVLVLPGTTAPSRKLVGEAIVRYSFDRSIPAPAGTAKTPISISRTRPDGSTESSQFESSLSADQVNRAIDLFDRMSGAEQLPTFAITGGYSMVWVTSTLTVSGVSREVALSPGSCRALVFVLENLSR